MSIPDDCRMTQSHEWHRSVGDTVTVGITKFAADELTDITFVDLPAVGTPVTAGESFGEIESVKATSELYCAVAGTVAEVNESLAENPEWVNEDPYGKGWMIRVKAQDAAPLDELMDPQAYETFIAS